MATVIPRNPTVLESLNQAIALAIPGFQQGQEKLQTGQSLQNLAGALGQQPGQTQQQQDLLSTLGGATGQFGQQLAGQLLGQQAQEAFQPTQQPGFTLPPGAQRFDAQGNVIAQVPAAPKPRAGELQVAKTGDATGLPEGTVIRAGKRCGLQDRHGLSNRAFITGESADFSLRFNGQRDKCYKRSIVV